MKKLLSLLILLCASSLGQNSTSQSLPTTFSTGSQTPLILNVIGSGTLFYQISWNVIGTLSACTVQVDSSATGIGGWGAADVIGAQTCTSNGTFTSTSHSVNFVRINSNASIAGSGSLIVTLTGYAVNPTGGGGGTITGSGTGTIIPIWSAGTVLGNSALTDSGGTLSYAGSSGFSVAKVTTSGTGAGQFGCIQGAAQTAPTNGVGLMCPTTVTTGFNITLPSAAPVTPGLLAVDINGVLSFSATPSIGGSTGTTPTTGTITYGGLTSGSFSFGCNAAACVNLQASGAIGGTKLVTTTNCNANGTAANPSVVACGSASSGLISCATAASTGTCTINTTIVTANSIILITPTAIARGSGVTACNTTADTGLTLNRIASLVANTSFTINLGTFATTALCFNYQIIN